MLFVFGEQEIKNYLTINFSVEILIW